jgi:hypothetical protein
LSCSAWRVLISGTFLTAGRGAREIPAADIHTATEVGARDPYQLGNQLAVLFEGARALATSLNDTSPCYTRSAAETLIDAATIDSGK